MTVLIIKTQDGQEFSGSSVEVCRKMREAAFVPVSEAERHKEKVADAVKLWNGRRIRTKAGADAFLLDLINARIVTLVIDERSE